MAHPVGKLTQLHPYGTFSGKRYGSFASKLGGITATAVMVGSASATMSGALSMVATSVETPSAHATLSMPVGNVKNVQPKG